jgi:CheY-like chemotaxis protein
MSYPLTIQPLVIEDEDKLKDVYQTTFETISQEPGNLLPFKIADPCYAFSHEQALKLLDGSKIFHVVVLDLRLPEKQGLPEVQDQDLGLDLLERCLNRDRYPVPALLVVSGHVGLTDQVSIQDRLRDNSKAPGASSRNSRISRSRAP